MSNYETLHDVNELDAFMAEKRMRLALMLILTGRLDPEQGMRLFDGATDPKNILEEREAMRKVDEDPKHFSHNDSPLGRMMSLYTRLPPREDNQDA